MKNNIAKVAERGERLDSLQDKTGTFRVWLVCLRFEHMASILFQNSLTFTAQKTSLSLLKDSVEGRTESVRYVVSV